jgi:hypothetical protein
MLTLDNIVTMNKTMVSYHTPSTTRRSKQRIKKGLPGSVKAKVHVSRTKQMVLVFYDSKRLVYMHAIPRDVTIDANYTVVVPKRRGLRW